MKTLRIIKKKAIDTAKDSYLLGAAPQESAACKGCGAIWRAKHWALPTTETTELSRAKGTTLCPACRKSRDKFAQGFVTIQGGFTTAHKEEIIRLLRNKEARAMQLNPLERIMEIKEGKGVIEVSTTTDKLAQKFGRMLHKTFSGEIEYKWNSDVKLARVVWTR